MRKRNVSFIADKLLWFIILILPLLFALVFTCSSMNNYQLEVSASESNSFDYILTNFNTSSTEYYYYGDRHYNNNFLNKIYVSSYASTLSFYFLELDFDISVAVGNSVLDADGDIIASLVESIDGYDVYVFEWLFFADYLDTGTHFSILGSSSEDYGYVYLIDNVVIPQSDNIFKTYFANLNYSLDNWFIFGDADIVYNAFNSIFGSQSNILPIFVEGSFIPKYLTYMAWIYVLHIAFDFLVFIPRLAHKWMGGVYNDDE